MINILFLFVFTFSTLSFAQENNVLTFGEPININITADNIADALFFLGGSRSELENDNVISATEKMIERLRFDLGCENLRDHYELNGESRACLYKNKTGNYTITGFVADKTIRAANHGPTRSSYEVFGVRSERHFIYNFIIGAEAGYSENKVKFLGKTYAESSGEYAAITISRPLEVRKKTARSLKTDNYSYKKMLEARELQQSFLQQFSEETY